MKEMLVGVGWGDDLKDSVSHSGGRLEWRVVCIGRVSIDRAGQWRQGFWLRECRPCVSQARCPGLLRRGLARGQQAAAPWLSWLC